jgi:chitinase
MCKHFPEMAADPIKRAKLMADVKRLVNQPLANKINEVFASSDPTDPLVAFTSPSNGDVFVPGSDIPLQVNASDPDGTVTQVEFSANGISVGVDTTAPYSLLWQGVSAGEYSLVPTVTDNSGKSVNSARLSVSVNDDNMKPQVSYDGTSGDINVDPLG